ncbi:MAG: recombinase family protein [Spirochaetes bacterium]|jgi:DNA invertase Pin-like site-specific DNA recombinase|nr:recombinase family protein [Spirochaetota bacterium]
MTTAAYLRVSTADQSADLQRRGIERFAGHADLDVTDWYCDEGASGRKETRPELDALTEAARRRDVECVVVWKFDRFARSASHLIRALDEFNHLGIRFVSVQDQIDTGSPMGKAMFTIIGAMAELESSLISERVRAGMEAARENGKHVGRPATPDAVKDEIRRLARETNLSIRKIQAELESGPLSAEVSRGVVGRVVKTVRPSE